MRPATPTARILALAGALAVAAIGGLGGSVLAMDGVPGPGQTVAPTDPPTQTPPAVPTAVVPTPDPTAAASVAVTATPDPTPTLEPSPSPSRTDEASPILVIAAAPSARAHASLPPTDTSPTGGRGAAAPIVLLALTGLLAVAGTVARLAPAGVRRRGR